MGKAKIRWYCYIFRKFFEKLYSTVCILDPDSMSEVLKYSEMTIVDDEICEYHLEELFYNGHICGRVHCGQSNSLGDSGGPVIYYSSCGVPLLIGIISITPSQNCEDSIVDAFTDIAYFSRWIKSKIKK